MANGLTLLPKLQQLADLRSPDTGVAGSEVGYKALWLQQVSPELVNIDPTAGDTSAAVLASVLGGALADGLCQVFVAGYQGAIRHVIPEASPTGWYSLLVSEDAQDSAANPPTIAQSLARQTPAAGPSGAIWQINGTKSWVASSRCVDQLLVRAKVQGSATKAAGCTSDTAQDLWFLCASQAKGVSLSHRHAPSFLPEVSQGFARFENLPIAADAVLDASPFNDFMYAESLHVGLALMGHMWSRWHQQDSLVTALQTKGNPGRRFATQTLAGLSQGMLLAQQPHPTLGLLSAWQDLLAGLVAAFESRWQPTIATEETESANDWRRLWVRDHRLTQMYAPMIHSRLAKQAVKALVPGQ